MTSVISDPKAEVDSAYSWVRLGISMLISTIGGVGMWSFVVALPTVQADFGVARGDISLAYTLLMLGFAGGSALAGRFADRFGIATALSFGAITIGVGYIRRGLCADIDCCLPLSQILIGFGTSTGFGPLIADVTHWFERRRGIAVGLCSSGNYFAGAIWPPIIQHFIANDGWRPTHIGIGILCVLALLPLSLLLRRRAPCSVMAKRHRNSLPTARSEFHRWRCRCCCRLPASPAASRCRCRRFISSPIAAISVTASRAAPTCSR